MSERSGASDDKSGGAQDDHLEELIDLTMFLIGALPPEEALLVRIHVAGCLTCRAHRAEIQPVVSLLARIRPPSAR